MLQVSHSVPTVLHTKKATVVGGALNNVGGAIRDGMLETLSLSFSFFK